MKTLWTIALLLLSSAAGWAQPVAPSNLRLGAGAEINTDNGVDYFIRATLIWQNNEPAADYVVVQTSTNGGPWGHDPATDVFSANVGTAVKKVPQSGFHQFRVLSGWGTVPPQTNSLPSNVLDVWGEQAPSTLTRTVDSTNQVTISWRDNSVTEDGFLVERATNSSFTGTVVQTSVGPNAYSSNRVSVVSTGFERDVTYSWRIYATNSAGHSTQPSVSISDTPNALPAGVSFWQVYNNLTGVAVIWGDKGGFVERWYVDASVGDTNNFNNVFNTVGGSTSYNWTDTSQTPGTQVYYRVSASNAVGVVTTPPQLVAVAQAIGASVWYIDVQATGNGTGTNWANAWPNFGSIAWANVQPGALIWIAPGNYNEIVYVGAGGTSNAPVTFKLATTNAPRAGGIAQLKAVANFSRPYVQWDGALSDAFTIRTISDITNNVGLRFCGDTNIARAFYTTATGTHIKWVEVTGDYKNTTDSPSEENTAALYFKDGALGDTEAAFCWIHDMLADNVNGSDGIVILPESGGDKLGAANIHHNVIERVRDNFIAGGGGLDVHDNLLRDWVSGELASNIHPDGIQAGAHCWRVYNNVIYDVNGEAIYAEIVQTNTSDVFIYNNLIFGTGKLTNGSKIYPNSGITWSTEPNAGFAFPEMTVSNVLIANNTFYGFDGNHLSVTRRQTECDNLVLRSWSLVNNLIFNHNAGAQFGGGYTSTPDKITGTNFTQADLFMDWNDTCGSNNLLGWREVVDYTPETLQPLGFSNNFSHLPQFADLARFDFHLLNAAELTGTNLSAWASAAPGIDKNLDGTSRSATGWPVGALSSDQGSGLVLWLPFTGWAGGVAVPDASGNGWDAQLPFDARYSEPTPTNGPNGLAAAYIGNGQFFGITNISQSKFAVLPTGSIAVWAKYDSYSQNNSLILDAGYDVTQTNSWRLGRVDGNWNTMFTVYDANGDRMYKVIFPDTGPATSWHHYAVAWDGTNIASYYDGVPYWETNQSVPFLRVGSTYDWMAIGTMHHDQGAWGGSTYPNCCYLGGAVADVRIYNRPLEGYEVAAIYYATNAVAPPGTNAPVAPTITVQPQSQSITAGGNASFSVTATGDAPLAYQWRLNGALLADATLSSYTTNSVPLAADGSSYSVVVTNAAGSVTSASAVLTVSTPAVTPTRPTLHIGTFNVGTIQMAP